MNIFNIYADVDAIIYDSKQKHQELHTSEHTIVPRTVIFYYMMNKLAGLPSTILGDRISISTDAPSRPFFSNWIKK